MPEPGSREATKITGDTLSQIRARTKKGGEAIPLTPEQLEALREKSRPDRQASRQEDETIAKRLVGRIFATDVDDPLEMERLGTILAGSFGGAKVGSRAGPLGTLVGGVAGAVGGVVAPEATLEVLEQLRIIPKGTRESVALSNPELRRIAEGEALLEAATFGTAAGIRLGGRTVGKALTRPGRRGQEAAEEAAKRDIDLAPFQVGKLGFGRGIINVLGRFPILGGPAKKQARRAQVQIEEALQSAPTRLGGVVSASELSARIFKDANNLFKDVSGAFGRSYDELFLKAKRAGVEVEPRNTVVIAQSVLDEIGGRAARSRAGEAAPVSEAATKVRDFIQQNIVNIGEEGEQLGRMTLGQADELLKNMDEFIANTDPQIRRQVLRLLHPVKGALKSDVSQNLTGPRAAEIGDELASLDAEFSQAMTFLFETATAKRFAQFQRRGLKGAAAPSEEATTQAIDTIASRVVDLNSPKSIRELKRLVTTDTYRKISANVVSENIDKAMRVNSQGETVIDSQALAKAFGLTSDTVARRPALKELLKDSPYTFDDIKGIIKAAQELRGAPVPDISTFVARRTILGGASSGLKGVLPFLALTSGTTAAGGAAAGGIGAVLAGLTFVAGGRGLIAALSNPNSARAFRTVMNQEADTIARREAFLRLGRAALTGGDEVKDFTQEELKELRQVTRDTAEQLFPRTDKGPPAGREQELPRPQQGPPQQEQTR